MKERWVGRGVESLITSQIKSATDVYDISHDLVKFVLINSIFTLSVHDSPVYHEIFFFFILSIYMYIIYRAYVQFRCGFFFFMQILSYVNT